MEWDEIERTRSASATGSIFWGDRLVKKQAYPRPDRQLLGFPISSKLSPVFGPSCMKQKLVPRTVQRPSPTTAVRAGERECGIRIDFTISIITPPHLPIVRGQLLLPLSRLQSLSSREGMSNGSGNRASTLLDLVGARVDSGPVDPQKIGVDLVAFAVYFNPDVDPMQLTGDSRSTRSFQGRDRIFSSVLESKQKI
ncbi:hypothetical protein HAX54_044556 [Datura stramonium]|uniref:Uncharacterized protein n=1 Tax=Datura stramonium TaxID=4076 RepID=A0ABS8WIR3_DATST|nr:hypothetical protein [Datura stramonium]